VLAAVPTHSLETELLAVKQVLDSGVTSIEQMRNVLSRRNNLPVPEPNTSGNFTKSNTFYNFFYVFFCQFKAAIDGCLEKLKTTFSGHVNCVPR
jgi:hypothetical protein